MDDHSRLSFSLFHLQVHVQNATLAGGVAIGTASNMSVAPWGALLIGCIAGALSTVGYAYVTVSEHIILKYRNIPKLCVYLLIGRDSPNAGNIRKFGHHFGVEQWLRKQYTY